MEMYDLLLAKALGGGGGGSSTTIEALNVTENGTYSAAEGTAYNPVTVAVEAQGITGNDIATRSGITGNMFGSAPYIPTYAFASTNITGADFSLADRISSYAFVNCKSLKTINFPEASFVSTAAFSSCTSLEKAILPKCSEVQQNAFSYCPSMSEVSLGNCTFIGSSAFASCHRLISLNLTKCTQVPNLSNNAFKSTPVANYSGSAGQFGSVYVPASLYDSFRTATNWSSMSARMVSV